MVPKGAKAMFALSLLIPLAFVVWALIKLW